MLGNSWLKIVRNHYERHPYPHYPLLATIKRHDTYALNLQALWAHFNGEWLQPADGRILLAGCGAFAPYPFRLSNPKTAIDAIDLSEANLRRARLHCILHGCSGVKFSQGSFLDSSTLPRRYHFIDAFGVLHHLDNPLHGFVSLADRLEPGGFLRVMVYGRYARQEAESIRRAARILKIDDVQTLKRLFKRSGKHSSLRDYLDASWEAKTDSGIADLFLHPSVNTYRMEEFLELTEQSGLKPLLFTHTGALSNPDDEIERFRELDWQKKSITNIICYLGRDMKGGASLNSGTLLRLNPALEDAVSIFQLKTIAPENRLGRLNPPLDSNARKFLRRFRLPVIFNELDKRDKYEAKKFIDAMFLISSK